MKIGILTFYHKSINYGGLLQSYALVSFLKKSGFDAEQIRYKSKNRTFQKGCFLRRFFRRAKYNMKLFCSKIAYSKKYRNAKLFRNIIEHSSVIYTDSSISKSLKLYDVFITGSDQVWNPDWLSTTFLLDFVPSTKLKIAYAVSIGKTSLSKNDIELYKATIKDFKLISVREKTAQDLLKDYCSINSTVLLDPTFLLSKEEWISVSLKSKTIIKQPFILCYFLGSNSNSRIMAKEFADKVGLKIASIKGTNGSNRDDKTFGDIDVSDAGPADFLWLINNASYIFTDSFHCCVFSLLFEKRFIVFQRNHNDTSMATRIYDLLSFFDANNRFCDSADKENYSYICTTMNGEYHATFSFEKLIDKSKSELIRSIDD